MPTVPVLGSTLHYRESGDPDGLPFVFLHGNPTSSICGATSLPAWPRPAAGCWPPT